MIELLNPLLALVTIVLGGFGFFAPRYTAGALDLTTTTSNMGLSELRASAGGLFLLVGVWCLLSGDPAAYFMLGVAYAGAGAGRMVSIILDHPPLKKALIFLAFEWGPAAVLIWVNKGD